MVSFNKLVRDKIPEMIERNGEKPIFRQIIGDEKKDALEQKLHEEIAEFFSEPSEEELADIQEVLRALAKIYELSWKRSEEIRIEKVQDRGGFENGIYLESVE